MRCPGGGRVSRRPGTLILCAFVAAVALASLGCSEDTLSPVAPTPGTTASAPGERASRDQATPSATVENGLQPQISLQVDGGFNPSGTPNGGFDGDTGPVAAVRAALDVVPAPPVPPRAGPDSGYGLATSPSAWSRIVPDLPGPPVAELESALHSPSPPRSEAQHDTCSAGPDAAELKSTAPQPVGPRDGVLIVDSAPILAASNAQGSFVSVTFSYRFALYKVVGSGRMEVEVGCGSSRDGTSTSYQVATPLDLQASYVWRARAFLAGAYGPWSEDATFRTVAVKLGAPQPLVPNAGATVPISTSFTVRNPTVEGNAGRVFIEVEAATDAGFTANVMTGRTQMHDRGETDVTLSRALQPSAQYYWRARATASAGAAGEVDGPWSDTVSFRTSAFRLTAPQPIAPRNGAVDVPIRPRPRNPQFTVRNAVTSAGAGSVNVQVQVAQDQAFANIVARGETNQRASGQTDVRIDRALMPDTRYFWRVRARLAADSVVVSDWTAVWSFTTGTTETGPTTAPGRGDCCPPPNRFDIVQAVLGRTGNLYRQDIQQFTQRVAACLAATDGDWGRRRNDSGAVGKDTVAYRTSKGPGRGPFSIDIMRGASGDNPRPHWTVQTHEGIEGRVGGSWFAVDGGNCDLGSVAAR